MMNQKPYYIDTVLGQKGSQVLEAHFPIETMIINNTTNARFRVYFGEVSVGIGYSRFDYMVDAFTFAQLPINTRSQKVTIEWEAPTEEFDFIRIDLIDVKKDIFFQTNAPLSGGVGLAQNVSIATAIPTGANTIGKVNLGTSDIDIARNGTSIAGESLSSGGSNVLGWLSEIAKRLKSTLTVTLAGAIPTGGNTIGKVDVNNFPVNVELGSHAMTGSPKTSQLNIPVSTVTALRVGASDLVNRKQIVLTNLDPTNTVYIGDNTVSNLTGFPLKTGASISFDQNPNNTATIYAYSTVSLNVAVMEVN